MSRTFYAGIDESNHGNFPEIFVAVFSYTKRLTIEGERLPKIRSHIGTKDALFQNRYSFLILRKDDTKRIPKNKLQGVVVSSLIFPKRRLIRSRGLDVFLDGEVSSGKIRYIRDMATDICSANKEAIRIHAGAGLDIKIPLVNRADRFAN